MKSPHPPKPPAPELAVSGQPKNGLETRTTALEGRSCEHCGRTPNRAMNEIEAAERLGLSVTTLRTWRHRGQGPPFVRFGRAVRYVASDLDLFIEASRVQAGEYTAEGGTTHRTSTDK